MTKENRKKSQSYTAAKSLHIIWMLDKRAHFNAKFHTKIKSNSYIKG